MFSILTSIYFSWIHCTGWFTFSFLLKSNFTFSTLTLWSTSKSWLLILISIIYSIWYWIHLRFFDLFVNVFEPDTPKGFSQKSNFVWCVLIISKHIISELYFSITGNSIRKFFTHSANFLWSVTLWFVSSFMVPLPSITSYSTK